ncbi:antibiotic resistance protein [Starkeya sp. ORNL1]|uniref:TfuA-like protein n=1 Tax=Starkeya sp. ORNL1 TaxID=2709380 RepID=UPI0014646861|nr:TfuA-like protein [Starkeya sp. ORNL1]QJP16946.1 antibiotic resistance protein [Starkeya sp. ORNL1]
MKIVFAGPSLYGHMRDGRIANAPSLVCRGPARQGDITRAVADGASVIGLIDGLFEHVAAPWHKEILHALSQGVAVYGAASMGALRAAECAAFGMIGVGEIYAGYASGELVDDDAVAQLHAPAELDYQPLTEALVNIEATLAASSGTGAIGAGEQDELLHVARRLHFKDRTIVRVVAESSLSVERGLEVAALLKRDGSNVKARDAKALIARL